MSKFRKIQRDKVLKANDNSPIYEKKDDKSCFSKGSYLNEELNLLKFINYF